MEHGQTRAAILLAFTVLFGANLTAEADISLPLKPGYAVHTFGVSPDADIGDGNATVRIYDTTGRDYNTSRPTADFNTTTYSDPRWDINTIGNVYGIAIDRKRNIYVTSSANWSPGYVDTGDADRKNVPVTYGQLGGGDTPAGAGAVYKLDATSGEPTVFASLPQKKVTITNRICEGRGTDVTRTDVGAGLGNIVYDTFHDQFFVSNFSDGRIYRLDTNGSILDTWDTNMSGIDTADTRIVKAPYGLAVSPDGKQLFFGTMETNYTPRLFSIDLKENGEFGTHLVDQDAQLTETITYSQNIGGEAYGGVDKIWAAYSDLAFTPEGDLLVGVRVGCEGNFATSYNHGGTVYLLKKGSGADGHYNTPGSRTSGGTTSYNDIPDGTDQANSRAGYSKDGNNKIYKRDTGAIPLHPDEEDNPTQAKLDFGPDDGYGGVAVWQTADGDFDLYASSADITTKEGVHGFMQFSGDFNISSTATLEKAVGYGAVKSSTSNANTNASYYDYKGIGGDVEVLSVVPVSIGSHVWEDTNSNGKQDAGEPGICGVTLKLTDADGNTVTDINGSSVSDTDTSGADCTYRFGNLPEGDYRVCVTGGVPAGYIQTPIQTAADNNDTEEDSNFKDGNCSGIFTLVANSEPAESGRDAGDDQDDAHDTWGNMTVDFGFYVPTPHITIEKATNGEDADTAADAKVLHYGDTVTWSYVITNTGNEPLHNIHARDDKEGNITCPEETLDVDENMTCTAKTGRATVAAYENNASVTADGNISGDSTADSDLSHYRIETVSLGSVVWSDTNNNGIQDAGEPGIAGAIVTLLDSSGHPVNGHDPQTTGKDGRYFFGTLFEGTYKVQVDMRNAPEYTPTAHQNSDANDDTDNDSNIAGTNGTVYTSGPVTLSVGHEPTETHGLADTDDADNAEETNGNMTVDFGFYCPNVHIGDLVWIEDDNDGDARTGTITYPPAGTVVTATASNGTAYTGTTDAHGRYDITVPANDTYTVTVDPPADTIPTAGSDDSAVPDTTSENHRTHDGRGTTVTVGTTDNRTLDFGFTPSLYRIGDLFWIDSNNNGLYDPGEKTISNAKVELLDKDGNVIASTITDADGHYHFYVPAGTYKIRFYIPEDLRDAGYHFVDIRKPGDDANKALQNGMTESAIEVGPGAATEDLTRDAAIQCPCAAVTGNSVDTFNTLGLLLMLITGLGLGVGAILQKRNTRIHS